MMDQVFLVANPVLPKAPLPDAAVPMLLAGLRDLPFLASGAEPQVRELFLDAGPAFGIVLVLVGQPSQAMQVLWQQYDSHQLERPAGLHRTDRFM